jgi:outer membrane lipoprotein carrier protein
MSRLDQPAKGLSSKQQHLKHTLVLVILYVCVLVCADLFVLFAHSRCAASEVLSISEILERVRQRYKTADFEADFVQESSLQAMGIVDVAKGHVHFRPPAMMRWHYKLPEEYFIITDGQTLWIYRPEDNQVMLGRADEYLGTTTGVGFFSDPERLRDDFVVQLASKQYQEKGRYVLTLVPKIQRSSLTKLLLFVSNSTFDILQSVTYNAVGDTSSIRFSGFKFNQGLDLSLFAFKVPRGADVIQMGAQ